MSFRISLMALTIEKDLPTAESLSARYPILTAHRVGEHRAAISRILRGDDRRKLAVIGPCSAWPMDAVRTYADRLARLQEHVSDQVLLVLRTYIQKPRTVVGWAGPLNQPDPLANPDIAEGIEQCSHLMYDVGQQLPLADEMLFTHNDDYFSGRVSYLAIGARSGEDMEHRYVASGMDMPVGVKNTTGGDIQVGVNGVKSVQAPHVFAHHQRQVRSSGNPDAHLILRGGGGHANYDPQSIARARKLLVEHAKQPALIIDASHDNSVNGHGKDPRLQHVVVASVMEGVRRKFEDYDVVKGFMIESFLKQGKQSDKGPFDLDGLSITDPCLGWEETEELIKRVAELNAQGA